MIKIGLLGAGQMGLRHAKAIALVPEAKLVAVADLNPELAAQAAAEGDALHTTDVNSVLDMELDAVINALPHDLHVETTLAAAQRGHHILLEKPMCLDMRGASQIVAAQRASGVKLMMGYVHRYRQEMLDAKDLIDAGALGQVNMVVDDFVAPSGHGVPAWIWTKARAGGGVLMYGGIHAVDRARWFLDSEVVRVYAQTRTYSGQSDVENGLTASLEFENGAIVTLVHNSPRYKAPQGWRIELFGTQGAAVVMLGKSLTFSDAHTGFTRTYERYNHFERQIRDFVAVIAEDREPWITAEDGVQSLAVVMAAYESARTGRPIELKEILADYQP